MKHVYVFQNAPICGEELAMLQETLKRWCDEQHVDLSSPQAERAAVELIDWFQFGLKHSDQLIEMLRRNSP